MTVSILKNLSYRYYSHYIIKFIGFMLIYYTINLNIVSSFMVLSNLYLGMLIYCMFESMSYFSFQKKKKLKTQVNNIFSSYES